MGILKGGINEVIATTRNNAAPMGIHRRNGKTTLVLFTGSHTLENVRKEGWVVANFTHDPVLYVRTAFGDLPEEMFTDEMVGGIAMQRLASADAWAAFTATIEHESPDSVVAVLTLIKELIREPVVHPVNRGFASVIDATVHATRYVKTRDADVQRLIEYHAGIIRKCGGKQELAALDLLMGYIGEKR